MHDAPSVIHPVGRPRWSAVLMGSLWLAGAAAAWAWSLQPQVVAWRLALAWTCVGACGLLAGWHWWRAPCGTLAWDGVQWAWEPAGGAAVAGELEVALDWQLLLLVCWRGAGRHQWLWLERGRSGGRWDDLRRAVYSRARPAALPAEPPAAKP